MPELPEVETICQNLVQKIIGKKIVNVIQNRQKLRIDLPNLSQSLKNAEISGISRRAKFIQIAFSNGKTLIVSLGMTGRMIFNSSGQTLNNQLHEVKYASHNHVIFEFDDSSKLIYNDIRRFGFMILEDQKNLENLELLTNLGPEPLSEEFNSKYLQKICSNRKMPIKNLLMSNELLVGVGNIYASEALFDAKIQPTRLANSISKSEITLLTKKIKDTLERAIKAGGSTLKDYANADGSSGYFQHEFKVYGKNGTKCKICSSIIQKVKQSGRSSFYCDYCQK